MTSIFTSKVIYSPYHYHYYHHLFFTNLTDLVNRCKVIPEISDHFDLRHSIPILDVHTGVALNKKSTKKEFQYHKANFDGLIDSMTDFRREFCSNYSSENAWIVDNM